MNTKLATSRMRTGQWADIIKEESGLNVDDYCAHSMASPEMPTSTGLEKQRKLPLRRVDLWNYSSRWRFPPVIYLQS